VIPFRPRSAPRGSRHPRQAAQSEPAVPDLAKYERREADDDYRHRMKMNALALIVTCLLIGGGLWLAETMAEIRKIQDCVMSGRQNCAPISSSLRY
jgi:hypothetical protein